jgi:quercetin dioxygenase-like cupin family protein
LRIASEQSVDYPEQDSRVSLPELAFYAYLLEHDSMFSFQNLNWDSIEAEVLSPHLQRQFINTEAATVARFVLKKGAVVLTHHHPNEQIAFVIEGALKFTLDGRDVTIKAGELLCIPANLPHSAEALEDTVDIDVFTPPRQDWLARDDAYLR